jgi:flagellar hook-associated protein 2
MAGFSMPGLGSGGALDIPAMLADIKKAEETKLNPYLSKKASYTNQVSSWGKISSSLAALNTNLGKIENEGFRGVSVGTNKAFKATAAAGTLPDSFEVIVERLAKAHKIGTAEQDSKTDQLGDTSREERTLKITVDGKEKEIKLAKDETSLEQIAKKINASGGDVTASVRAGEGGGYTLVMTSKKTGEDGEIKVEVEGDAELNKVLNYDPSIEPKPDPDNPGATLPPSPNTMSTVAFAQNAVIIVDGERTTHSSNTVTSAIDGITLELQQVSEKDGSDFVPENLTVTSDNSKLKGAIEEFVKLYNAFISDASSASAWKAPEEGSSGPNPSNGALMGNSTLRRLTGDMREIAVGSYGELSEKFSSLAEMGIKVEVDDAGTGKLTIDSKKLEEAMKENPEDLEALFLGKDGKEGISDKMQTLIKSYIGDSDAIPKTTGIIKDTTKGLEEQGKQVTERITQMTKMIDATIERNRKDFERLDLAMSKMTNTQNQLTGLLASFG